MNTDQTMVADNQQTKENLIVNTKNKKTSMRKTRTIAEATETTEDANASVTTKKQHLLRRGGIMFEGSYLRNNELIAANDAETLTLFGESYTVMDSVYGVKTIWALKSFLPFIKEDSYDQLRSNIEANGIVNPLLYVVTENGDRLLVDGHTRLCAAIDLGIAVDAIPMKQIPYNFRSIDEMRVWLLEHQSQRRVVNTTERVKLAMQLRETIVAMAKENNSIGGREKSVEEQVHTNKRLAQIAGVGVSTITRYLQKMGISEKRPRTQKSEEVTPSNTIEMENKPTHFGTLEDANKAMEDGLIDALVMVTVASQIKSITATSIKLGYIFKDDALVGWANHEKMNEAA